MLTLTILGRELIPDYLCGPEAITSLLVRWEGQSQRRKLSVEEVGVIEEGHEPRQPLEARKTRNDPPGPPTEPSRRAKSCQHLGFRPVRKMSDV